MNVRFGISIGGHINEDQSNQGLPDCKNGLVAFFENHKYGILTVNSFSIIWHVQNKETSKTFVWMIYMLEGQRVTEQHPEVNHDVCVL